MERRRRVAGGFAALAALLLVAAIATYLSCDAQDVHEHEGSQRRLASLRNFHDPKSTVPKPAPPGPQRRPEEEANAIGLAAKAVAAAGTNAQQIPALAAPVQSNAGVEEAALAVAVAMTDSQQTAAAPNLVVAPRVATAPTRGTFFIDVSLFGEGLSGWRVTLNQILRVVDAIPGAQLVEPCMMNGRLRSCGGAYPEGLEGAPVPASEIFDLSWALESAEGRPPTMVLYGDFVQYTQQQREREVRQFHICLKASQQVCPEPYIERWALPHIVESARNDNEISIYTIHNCWWGRCALELDKHFLRRYNHPRPDEPLWLSSEAVLRPDTVLRFHPNNFQAVKDVLAHHNINNRYSLIHWRAEKPQLDYLQCAQRVVEAKHNLQSNQLAGDANHPFLLMTSVQEDSRRQWNGEILQDIASNGTPKEALDILADDGFIRFDQLLREANVHVRDPGMLGVYELILATSAQYFSTCANGTGGEPGSKGKGVPPGCSAEQNSICRECNYVGKFARLALDLRLETPGTSVDSTMGCWPV